MVGMGKMELQEGTESGLFGFAGELHADFMGQTVAFAGVTGDARANHVFPARHAAFVSGEDVIDVEFFPVELFLAVLAGKIVAFENILAGELNLFFGKAIEDEKDDDARDTDLKPNGANHLLFGVLHADGAVVPLVKVEGLIAVGFGIDDLGLAIIEEAKGSAD
jgi:hypothetical protein